MNGQWDQTYLVTLPLLGPHQGKSRGVQEELCAPARRDRIQCMWVPIRA